MGQDFSYQVIQRKIKYPRLEFKTDQLIAVIPEGESVLELIEKHKNWILRKKQFIEKVKCGIKKVNLIEREDSDLENLVEKLVKKYAAILKVRPRKIYFRRMKTKWASCSSKKNLRFNRLMKYLPEKEINYIIFHEMCHLRTKRHNRKFWMLVSHQFPNYQKQEKNLFGWWFLINQKYKI
jgi:hypothetical protein